MLPLFLPGVYNDGGVSICYSAEFIIIIIHLLLKNKNIVPGNDCTF